MTGADGVASHVREHLQLPLQRAVIQRRAQRPQIMMIANTIEQHVLAIDEKSRIRVEPDRPNPKRRVINIQNLIPLRYRRFRYVAIRLLLWRWSPEFGIGNSSSTLDNCV